MASRFKYTLTAMPSTPLIMGFGGEVCNSVSLQVTFLDANGNKLDPSSADLWLTPSNDLVNFGSSKLCEWTFGTQTNADLVDQSGGSWCAFQLNGTFSLGSAANAVVAVSANNTGRLV